MFIQIETDLFTGLADSASQTARIIGIPPAAGKAHMTRPGIAFPHRAFDHEHLDSTATLVKGNCHGRLTIS